MLYCGHQRAEHNTEDCGCLMIWDYEKGAHNDREAPHVRKPACCIINCNEGPLVT
jgi:hypothetical protein